MHLGLIIMEFPPDAIGGIGSFAYELVHGLVDAGQEVTVLVPNLRPEPCSRWFQSEWADVQQRHSPRLTVYRWMLHSPRWLRWRPGVLWHRWQLRKMLHKLHREKAFDVLETQDLYGPLPFGGVAKVPTVVRHHSSATFYDKVSGSSGGDSLTYWLERRTAQSTRHHIAVSQFVGQGVRECFDLRSEDITTIPYGIDTNLFQPATSGGIEAIPGRIVFVNSIGPRKGVRQLCLAFERVLTQIPEASLQLIGRTDRVESDGRRYAEVCLEGLSEHTRSRIEFTGALDRQTELVPALQKAAVCCFPSQLETFGIAPLEAMAVGKPVVYMNHGPGPEIISDGINGLLCDTASPDDIAAKLLVVLTNPAFANQLANAARCRSLDYRQDSWVEKNLAYYERIIAKTKKVK